MSGYSGGGASRESNVLKSWMPRELSAASDIDLNLDLLRNRASDLARNTAIGQAAITTSARATIGEGLKVYPRPNARVLGLTAEQARQWGQRAAEEFRVWSETSDCDVYRRNNFFDQQYIAYASYLTDGDVFCVFRRNLPTPRNPYTLRLQLLEANRVSTPTQGAISYNRVEGRAANGNRIINGIEVDADGGFQAVYVSNKLENDLIGRDQVTEWVRVAAYGDSGYPNLLQVAHDTRAGQYRGEPYLASVIEPMKQTARYADAELSSAIVKSFFSLFFVQPLQNFDISEILNKMGSSNAARDLFPEVDASEYRLGMGTLNALPRGVDVRTVDSGNSISNFAPFMNELDRQIGAALGIPYEVLLKSFGASYSASRAALLQAHEEFKQRRRWFIRDFCQPVYEMWLTEAIGCGMLDAPGYFDDARARLAWKRADWYGPSMSTLDPLKEQQASELRVMAGYSTRQRESAELTGTDYDENMEQQEYERAAQGSDEDGRDGLRRDRAGDRTAGRGNDSSYQQYWGRRVRFDRDLQQDESTW